MAGMPDFNFEKDVWEKGFSCVAGIDEVGRGSFAGPVVAGAVVFPSMSSRTKGERSHTKKRFLDKLEMTGIVINDSKKLTKLQREKAEKWIKENCLAWGIGEASVTQINKLGLTKASNIAFRNAIKACNLKIDFLLIDAFYIPFVKGLRRKNQKAIIKGDSKSLSIAAASILAKVYRDKLMEKLATKHPQFNWEINCGYGTKSHRDAILKHGITKQHRKLFVRKLKTENK